MPATGDRRALIYSGRPANRRGLRHRAGRRLVVRLGRRTVRRLPHVLGGRGCSHCARCAALERAAGKPRAPVWLGPLGDGVKDVHHVHAWSLTSGRNVFSGHIRVESFPKEGERVLREASERLKERFGVYFSTLQIEGRCLASEQGAGDIDITRQQRP